MVIIFIISFLVCFISYCLHTYWHHKAFTGADLRQRGIAFNILTHVVVFTGYLAFGFMIGTDPLRININIILRIIGLIAGLSGLVVALIATIEKSGYEERGHLITTGIYSIFRNPMYLGLIFLHIGLPLYTKSMITLLTASIWIPFIMVWKYWEEKHLEKKFGEQYINYKKRTLF